jgi:hypothetical protein
MEKSDNGDIERERENDLLVYGYNMINWYDNCQCQAYQF